MSQNYKVFINGNVLVLTNTAKMQHGTTRIVHYDLEDFRIKDLIFNDLMTRRCGIVQVLCECYVDRCWNFICSLFEVRRAAGGLVRNDAGKFLFIKRNNLWDIPKGHIEAGESSRECALREVEEECGISGLSVGQLICTTYHTYFIDNRPILKSTDWYNMSYSGNQQPMPQTEEDITEVVWIDMSDIDKLLKDSYSSIPEVIAQMRCQQG